MSISSTPNPYYEFHKKKYEKNPVLGETIFNEFSQFCNYPDKVVNKFNTKIAYVLRCKEGSVYWYSKSFLVGSVEKYDIYACCYHWIDKGLFDKTTTIMYDSNFKPMNCVNIHCPDIENELDLWFILVENKVAKETNSNLVVNNNALEHGDLLAIYCSEGVASLTTVIGEALPGLYWDHFAKQVITHKPNTTSYPLYFTWDAHGWSGSIVFDINWIHGMLIIGLPNYEYQGYKWFCKGFVPIDLIMEKKDELITILQKDYF